jgi:NAD(P)-dependent dehydrogenase (short-subunit alcohol dehydrogenase family)
MIKKALVTGASGNMGRAVIKKFLDEGYYVIGTMIPGDPTALDIEHADFEKSVVDLLNEQDTDSFIAALVEKHTAIDVAVLTVGGFAMGTIKETTTAQISKQVSINFETAYNIARPVFNQMMKQLSGRIFLAGSRPGLEAQQGNGMVAYSLGKSLLFRLAELMNIEAKGTDVVTSVIVPGTIDTASNRKAMPEADFSTWVKAEDIAGVIYYYCTDEAKAIREPVIKLYNKA